jgi:hypothetical protein
LCHTMVLLYKKSFCFSRDTIVQPKDACQQHFESLEKHFGALK